MAMFMACGLPLSDRDYWVTAGRDVAMLPEDRGAWEMPIG
jgi:hypothetical protein